MGLAVLVSRWEEALAKAHQLPLTLEKTYVIQFRKDPHFLRVFEIPPTY